MVRGEGRYGDLTRLKALTLFFKTSWVYGRKLGWFPSKT